jgi:hypothetical protein
MAIESSGNEIGSTLPEWVLLDSQAQAVHIKEAESAAVLIAFV